jgi:hypothetical protein
VFVVLAAEKYGVAERSASIRLNQTLLPPEGGGREGGRLRLLRRTG